MQDFGARLARAINLPCLIELTGDVGTGKTTLVKGLARALGVPGEVTSPSFTINQRYETDHVTLSHYDFYRLDDAGIMKNEILESLEDPQTVVIVEWAGAVEDALPAQRIRVNLAYNDDGSRTVETDGVQL